MLTAKETEIIMDKFFGECFRYWKMQNYEERKAFEYALDDIKNMKRDPYVPTGKLLDIEAKNQYIHYREMDLGRR